MVPMEERHLLLVKTPLVEVVEVGGITLEILEVQVEAVEVQLVVAHKMALPCKALEIMVMEQPPPFQVMVPVVVVAQEVRVVPIIHQVVVPEVPEDKVILRVQTYGMLQEAVAEVRKTLIEV